MGRVTPPMPRSRPEGAGPLTRLRLFRKDMFRSQPARLYGAKMAEMAVLGRRSFLVNQPDLVAEVLERRAADFPKARALGESLAPLLGRSVFLTNGADWARQRRMVDPALAASGLRRSYPHMQAAVAALLERLGEGPHEVEAEMSRLAADIIFRTLFSLPIDGARAREVFDAFRAYQRAQPLLSPSALLGWRGWVPGKRAGTRAAQRIREMLRELIEARHRERAAGAGPDDMLAALIAARDPQTGQGFDAEELVDQVAILFLAGHETSAAAMAWALWCLAADAEAQSAVRAEVLRCCAYGEIEFEDLGRLGFARDVVREVLRLYPPVPMLPREAATETTFRARTVPKGAFVIVSPWHLQRHDDHWSAPHQFDPWRWGRAETGPWLPFSRGPRACPGAGFAMAEAVLAIASLVRAYDLAPGAVAPVPVAHLTVRAAAGISVTLRRLNAPDPLPSGHGPNGP